MAQLEELIGKVMSVDAAGLSDSDGPETIAAWDSLNQIVLAGALEEQFGVSLSADELIAARSIGDFRRLLRGKGLEV